MTTIVGSIEGGHYVARVPAYGIRVRVPLKPIGERLGGVEIGAICANLGTPEISGRRWRRMKRRFKKVVKVTVKIAKKIANNKIVKQLYQAAKQALPVPYNIALAAVETGVRFGKAMAQGNPKAKAALPAVKALASGKITLSQATGAARRIGIKPSTIKGAAAMLRIKAAAATDRTAARLLAGVAEIESVASDSPKTRGHIVTAKSGRRYRVTLARAA